LKRSYHGDLEASSARHRRYWTVALAVFLTIVSALAIPTSIQPGDAGEFATVMLRGGVPPPSGYPWMRLLGSLARVLEALGLPAASAAAWPCAAAGIAGWLVLHRVALGWVDDRRSFAAVTFAIAFVSCSRIVVVHTNDSEVWGPLVGFSALVVYACDRWHHRPFVVGLALGLAASHHLTAALWLPLVVTSTFPARDRGFRALLVVAGLGILGGIVGLLPYATLAIGGGVWRWGDTGSFEGLVRHVLRADYGVFALSLHREQTSALDHLARAWSSSSECLGAGLTRSPVLAAVVVTAVAVAVGLDRTASLRRRIFVGLLGTFVLSAIVFPTMQDIDPNSAFGRWILERFDIATLVAFAPLLAVACARLARLSERRSYPWLLAIGGLAVLARQLAFVWTAGVPATNSLVGRYAADVLRTPAAGQPAIVIGTDDHRLFPLLFARFVSTPDTRTTYVDASLLVHPWYRAHLQKQVPSLPDVDKPIRLIQAIWASPNAELASVPIYLSNDFSRHSTALPRVPEGILWRVVPPTAKPEAFSPLAIYQRHKAALSRYGLDPGELTGLHDPFASDLASTYLEGTRRLVEALQAAGFHEQADDLRAMFVIEWTTKSQ
jgi:hypothetical protein